MYSIFVKEYSEGEVLFDTLEEAKLWRKHYEADIDWSHNRRKYKLFKEAGISGKDGNGIDISKEVDWL